MLKVRPRHLKNKITRTVKHVLRVEISADLADTHAKRPSMMTVSEFVKRVLERECRFDWTTLQQITI